MTRRGRIVLVTPALADANNGNWRTAARWRRALAADHDLRVCREWDGAPADAMIALHARRSAASVRRWADMPGGRPGGLAVVLTGTDLYRDIARDADAQASLDMADALVVLQDRGIDGLPEGLRGKARVIVQSAPRLPPLPPRTRTVDLLLVGHLRPEKNPLTAARALARLDDARLRLRVAGGAQDAGIAAAMRDAATRDPRILLMGALPHAAARRLIRRGRLLLLPSVMEGGANVLIEAVRSGVPVLASRIDGTTGLLGDDHPGLFPVGDDAALAALVRRALDDPSFMDALRRAGEAVAARFEPALETAALRRLAADLLAVGPGAGRCGARERALRHTSALPIPFPPPGVPMNAPDPNAGVDAIRLTSFSHGGGCGCKIAPGVLSEILRGANRMPVPPQLLVGIETADDAAVWKLNDEQALIATTDFFMPIVDDPFDFGRIAATNAISDVYAMGGTPIMALALVGMPIDRLPMETIRRILEGGESVCAAAGIPIAGGHTIDSVEPIYGLVVMGLVHPDRIKRNAGAKPGDVLVLGKPLGVGVLSAALKREVLDAEGYATMIASTTKLNVPGRALSSMDGVHALTDVTGFGLLGHLLEICRGARLRAELRMDDVPLLPRVRELAGQGFLTGASGRNWMAMRQDAELDDGVTDIDRALLTDPQTSGGLLVACAPDAVDAVIGQFRRDGFAEATVVGTLEEGEPRVRVRR